MKRPIKNDYLTTNQFTYHEKLNEYYDELEKYVDELEQSRDEYSPTGIVISPEDLSKLQKEGIVDSNN